MFREGGGGVGGGEQVKTSGYFLKTRFTYGKLRKKSARLSCLCQILGIAWPGIITNEKLCAKTGQEMDRLYLEDQREHMYTTRMIMTWNPHGKRKQGRLKQSWRRAVTQELDNIGKTWNEAKKIASNRARCRAMVEGLSLRRGEED